MGFTDDPRLDEARRIDIATIESKLAIAGQDKVGLGRPGWKAAGPCPACGGTDRCAINTRTGLYNCRSCGGGDAIALVRLVRGCYRNQQKRRIKWLNCLNPNEFDLSLKLHRQIELPSPVISRNGTPKGLQWKRIDRGCGGQTWN